MRCTLTKIEEINNNVKTFWLKPSGSYRYSAGQFTEIKLPHRSPDNRGESRWFTISSSPSEELVALTTKFALPPERSSTYKSTLNNLPVGSELEIAEAMGDFVLPINSTVPLVFIAGGMGITPFRSIVKSLSDSGEKRKIEMIYSVRNKSDLIFLDVFNEFGIEPKVIISTPTTDWNGLSGHINGQLILNLIKDLKEKLIFVSGPELMVENLEKDLLDLGVQSSNLVLDFFPGYKPV